MTFVLNTADKLLLAVHDRDTGVSDDLALEAVTKLRRLTGIEKRVRERLRYYRGDAQMHELMEYLLNG